MTRFRHTGQDQMIEGCKFIGGVFATDSPEKIKSIMSSRSFGKTVFEMTDEEIAVTQAEVKPKVGAGMKTTSNK